MVWGCDGHQTNSIVEEQSWVYGALGGEASLVQYRSNFHPTMRRVTEHHHAGVEKAIGALDTRRRPGRKAPRLHKQLFTAIATVATISLLMSFGLIAKSWAGQESFVHENFPYLKATDELHAKDRALVRGVDGVRRNNSLLIVAATNASSTDLAAATATAATTAAGDAFPARVAGDSDSNASTAMVNEGTPATATTAIVVGNSPEYVSYIMISFPSDTAVITDNFLTTHSV